MIYTIKSFGEIEHKKEDFIIVHRFVDFLCNIQ